LSLVKRHCGFDGGTEIVKELSSKITELKITEPTYLIDKV